MSRPSIPDRPADSPSATAGVHLYRVGTLTYTRVALLQVMFWMLWGDFFFILMESLTPALIPLQLRWEGASDLLIGLQTSLSSVLCVCLYPFVGMQSDRHRGRLGRRRPFLLWCTPPVVLSLVLLGVAKPAGALLQRVLSVFGGANLTAAGCTIAWIGMCTMVFVLCNAYIVQTYGALVADVIPQEVLGKFFGFYRALGAIGSLAFNRRALGWAETHTLHVYGLIGLLYASAFLLIVWRVKEGDYPPPPAKAAGGSLGAIKGYFKECFTHRFYLNYYCVSFFFWSTLPPLAYVVFFATQSGNPGYAATLGLTLQEFGQVKGWTFAVQIPVYFLVGPLVDRFHPLRVCMVGMSLASLSYFSCFWFIHDGASLLLWWSITLGSIAIFGAAIAALGPRLLPRDKYGQFVSANTAFGYVGLILTPPLVGLLLERIRDYRYIFAMCGVSTALAFMACVTLFLQWKKRGGDLHFTPPETVCGELRLNPSK